jgi:RNA polymerase sigma factor (sigma-70 family)
MVKKPGFPARLIASASKLVRNNARVSRKDAFVSLMNAEELFLANVPTIDRIAAFICRRHHVADDAEEFAAQVKLDLIERNYEIVRKFEGRATFSTYLTTVMHRLFYQDRVREWGKWRPSAEAKRLGDGAIALEKLLTRDGFTFGEAVRKMTADGERSVAELEAIHLRLPPRQSRPMLVSEDSVSDVASSVSAEDSLESHDREQSARAAVRVLDEVIATFDPEDRLILQLRFWHARRVADIATDLHLDQKKTYKRIDKLLARLRGALERAGLSRSIIEDVVTHGDHEIHLGENPDPSPSEPVTGNFGSDRRLSP